MNRGVRFVYTNSAATYGAREVGYSDQTELSLLRSLNSYGFSEHLFDVWMTERTFGQCAAELNLSYLFGPGESFKGDMSSVVLKAWQRASTTESVKLFKLCRPDFLDGEQKRDFVYIKDSCKILWWLPESQSETGLLNVGSGRARSWNGLVKSVFTTLDKPRKIEYICPAPSFC